MNKKHCFNLAKKESEKSIYGRTKIGCILVYNGSVISRGHNGYKTHPLQEKQNLRFRYKGSPTHYYAPTIHAELECLAPVRWLDIDWSRAELYTYRETADGKLAMCRPCPACMDLIKNQFGIRKIHYTTDDGYATEVIDG